MKIFVLVLIKYRIVQQCHLESCLKKLPVYPQRLINLDFLDFIMQIRVLQKVKFL